MSSRIPLLAQGPPFLRRADRPGDDLLDMLLEASLRDPGLRVVKVACDGASTWPDAYRRLSDAFELPTDFGDNLDALEDALTDEDLTGGKRVAIVFVDTEELLARETEGARFRLLSALSDAGKFWAEDGSKAFHTYLQFGSRIPADLNFAPVIKAPGD